MKTGSLTLAYVCVIHDIEEKKVLALLIRQVKGTCTTSLLALSRSVDDVCRLQLPGRGPSVCMTGVFRLQIADLLGLESWPLRQIGQAIQYGFIGILRRPDLSLTRSGLQLRMT